MGTPSLRARVVRKVQRLTRRSAPVPQNDSPQRTVANQDPGIAAASISDLKLAYLIPASPTDGFYSQVAMFRLALDALGSPYRDARIILTIGSDESSAVPLRWEEAMARVDVSFVRELGDQSYRAQVAGRWSLVPEDTDIVVLGNADTLPLARYDELLQRVAAEGIVAGAIVHSPLQFRDGVSNETGWRELARRVIGRDIRLDYRTTVPGPTGETAATPYYVNGGAVFIARPAFEKLRPIYLSIEPEVADLIRDPRFSHQASLALAICAAGVPKVAMDMRYNFPNDQHAEAAYPEDAADIRTIHFLRTTRFDRQQVFVDSDPFHRFLALPLEGSEARMQARVREITAGRYPFT